MKKILIALLPALGVHVALFFMDKTQLSQGAWAAVLLGVLLGGGVISAALLIQSLKEKNVERGPALLGGIGAVVAVVYLLVFSFSGVILVILLDL